MIRYFAILLILSLLTGCAELVELRDQNAQLRENLAQTERRLILKTNEADQLRQQRDDQRAAFEAEFERRGERLQESMTEADGREEKLLQRIEKLQAEIDTLKEKQAALQKTLKKKDEEIKTEKEAGEKLRGELASSQAALKGEGERAAEMQKLADAALNKEKQARGQAEAELDRLKTTAVRERESRANMLDTWRTKLDLACGDAIAKLGGEIVLDEAAGELTVRLSANALFSQGVIVLDEGAVGSVDQIAAWLGALMAKPEAAGWRLAVVGHADNQPIESLPFANNTELSIRRAFAVALQLQRKVPKDRISVAAFGEHAPIAKNTSPEGRRKNRRVELILNKSN